MSSRSFLPIVAITALFGAITFVDSHSIAKRQNFYYQPQSQYAAIPVHRPLRQKEKEERQDLSKVPGVPGVDFPLYHSVPHTDFDCKQVPAVPGIYADIQAGCQAYHVCQEDRDNYHGGSFLCTNGTLFNQKEFTCDWWYNVNCHEQPQFYSLNLDPIKNPYAPKPKPLEEEHHILEPQLSYHGRAYHQ